MGLQPYASQPQLWEKWYSRRQGFSVDCLSIIYLFTYHICLSIICLSSVICICIYVSVIPSICVSILSIYLFIICLSLRDTTQTLKRNILPTCKTPSQNDEVCSPCCATITTTLFLSPLPCSCHLCPVPIYLEFSHVVAMNRRHVTLA